MNIFYYIKMSFFGMKKARFHSFIAIFGLSLAFTCSFFVFSWFKYELSYDTFYKNSDRIFQLNAHFKESKEVWLGTPFALLAKLKDFPEIEEVAVQKIISAELPINENTRPIVYVLEAYTDFFSIFPQTFVARNSEHFGPTDIILTEDFVLKNWGSLDVLGKMIGNYTIKAIVKSPPANTTLPFDAIIPRSADKEMLENWGRHYYSTFIRLAEGVDEKQFSLKLKESIITPDNDIYYGLVPLYLSKHILDGKSFFEAFSFFIVISIALLLLFISALFNFVMLSISRFLSRLKTYAIHKAMGANSIQIIGILYGEILLSLAVVFIMTCVFVELLQGYVISFTQLPISSTFLLNEFVKFVFFCMLFICICSCYPVFYIRLITLKNMLIGGSVKGGKGQLDVWMVGLQLIVTILFSFFILGMVHQFMFMTKGDLGYATKNIDRFKIESEEIKQNIVPFMNELRSNSAIIDIIWCDYDLFGYGAYSSIAANEFLVQEDFDINDKREIYYYPIMKDLFPFFKFSLKQGRFWDGEDRDGLNEVLVNEVLVDEFGEKDIIGKVKMFKGIPVKVVGIIKDFHNKPMKEPIRPSVFVNSVTNGKNWANSGFWQGAGEPSVCYFKYDMNREKEALEFVKKVYMKYSEGYFPYITSFEQYVSTYYKEEKRTLMIFFIVAIISLFITIMGLFALVSFKLCRRRREIALRKIQGASIFQIIFTLMKEYFYLILVSSILGFPVAYMAVNSWLLQYQYRIIIGPIHFLIVLFFVVIIVFLTVIGQVVKTTYLNPINVIKENNQG